MPNVHTDLCPHGRTWLDGCPACEGLTPQVLGPFRWAELIGTLLLVVMLLVLVFTIGTTA